MQLNTNIVKNINISDISLRKIKKKDSYLFNIINKEISDMKALIDKLDKKNNWDIAKKITNPYELIYTNSKIKDIESVAKYKPISRSFFKFWEINNLFNIIDKNNTKYIISNLAEGPGGFIDAILKIRNYNKHDICYGITLYNHNKFIPDWNKLKLLRIKNIVLDYGNLYELNDINKYINHFKTNKAHITTADGGFDYSSDFNSQEINSIRIIFSEISISFMILEIGGSFICKLFDIYTLQSVKLIYLLYCYFKEINIYKPKTSRPANSEKYIICKYFTGIEENDKKHLISLLGNITKMYDKSSNDDILDFNGISVPNSFLSEINKFNKSYSEAQLFYLNTTLQYIKDHPDGEIAEELYLNQIKVAREWCTNNNLEYNLLNS